jgi:hypothetical protein
MNNKLNEQSETNKIETTFSFVWLYCQFCILQKIRHYYQERLHIDFSSGTTDDGELADVELVSASWSGMGNNWNPLGDNTVLYRADKSVTVYNRFMISLALPNPITLNLKADAADVTIGGLNETTVTIGTNKISTGGKSVAGVAGFIAFTANANTANAVKKEESTFVWKVTKINNKTTGTGQALEADTITFYTVLEIPKEPWDVNDSHASSVTIAPGEDINDNKNQPWTVVLDKITQTDWCQNQSNFDITSEIITTKLSNLFKYEYLEGGSCYYVNNTYFDMTALKNLLIGGGRASANCLDIAWSVTSLSNLLGDNLVVKNIFDTKTNPSSSPWTLFTTNVIQPVGMTIWDVSQWRYHAVAVRVSGGNNYIYDACIMLNQSSPTLPIKMLWSSYMTSLCPTLLKLEDNIFTFQQLR